MACLSRYPFKADAVALIVESDPCVDEFETTPPTATNVMQVVEDSISWTAEYDEAEANAQGGNYGSSRSSYDAPRISMQFDMFASGPGTALDGVPYNDALGAAKYAESGLAAGTATYTLATGVNAPITVWMQSGSWLVKAYGVRGSVSWINTWQGFRICRFNGTGQAGLHVAGTLPAGDFSAWQDRVMVSASNISTWTIHGNAQQGRDCNVNGNSEISQVSDSGGQLIDITDWAASADIVVADNGVDNWLAIAQADTSGPMVYALGTVAQNIMTITCADMQIRAPSKQNVNNYHYWGMTGRITNEAVASGDDIVVAFS